MKTLIASHTHNIYLKPGEVCITRKPVLISTVLGSCVAVTMYSPLRGYGAICHAMLPESGGRETDFRYVDSALFHLFDKISAFGIGDDLEVKLFGGAQVLDVGERSSERQTVGEQNVAKAEAVLTSLGLAVSIRDTGGLQGRRLYFCTRSGDVYMRRMHHRRQSDNEDGTP